jgi:hypothetical protein
VGEGRGARGGERDRAGASEDREVRDGRRVMRTFDLKSRVTFEGTS